MDPHSAPGLDGFPGLFLKSFWDIVGQDVVGFVRQFFVDSWLHPGANSNLITLIPKSHDADTVSQYRPIALANFIFLLIQKILADRLPSIVTRIISPQQNAFIKGRSIHDCIGLVSEHVQLLDRKAFGGNIGIKLDIHKAFDTLHWDFLLVEEFDKSFMDKLLARLLVKLNPFIFLELNLHQEGKLLSRFLAGSLPFTYLGVPIFRGCPRATHLQSLADKVRAKLSGWKGKLLSLAGRVQLVQSVVQAMLLHSFMIYKWPLTLLKRVMQWIRNFIWSGDLDKRKLVTISWDTICLPKSEGGLGLRNLIALNKAALLKFTWNTFQRDTPWRRDVFSAFKSNCRWIIGDVKLNFPLLHAQISSVELSIEPSSDKLIWEGTTSGDLSFADSFETFRSHGTPLGWDNLIWHNFLPPKYSLLAWRVLHGKLPTEDQLQIRGFHLASVCQLCATPCSGESISHLFFQCSFAQQVWQWLASQFVTSLPFAGTLHTLWNAIASKGFKSQLRKIWLVACLHSFHLIWKVRNRLLFDNIRVSIHQALAACKAEILFISNTVSMLRVTSLARAKSDGSFVFWIGDFDREWNHIAAELTFLYVKSFFLPNPPPFTEPAFAVVYSSYFYADSQVAALASASSGVESDVSSASPGPLSSSYGSAETPIALCFLACSALRALPSSCALSARFQGQGPPIKVRISCLCFDLRFGYVGCGKNWKVSAGRITLQPVQIERERAALGSASEDDACAMYHPSDSSYSRCGAFFSE
ncbi:hypothetical protein Patl1_37495 [Pistacia atlantica]|nr:hypothetical protein Patl1_37495 [Pistacia atlantica]